MKKQIFTIILTLTMSGCFIFNSINNSSESSFKSSDSVKSISTSIRSISKSISSISTSSSKKAKAARLEYYKSDISETTAMHLKAGMEDEAFRYDLARVALKHGISNWQAETFTYLGIGEGLKKAGFTPAMLEKVTGEVNPEVNLLIAKGYSSL